MSSVQSFPSASRPLAWLHTRDGVRLRTSVGGRGPAVVLVHGWKGSHRLWDKLSVALQERAYTVARFDLRGMGESDKPDTRYDFEEFSGDLGQVLEQLALDDVTLVGWSMGCTVALRYLERDGARVARLVLVNGPLCLTRTDDFPWAMPGGQLDGYLQQMAHGWPASERQFQAESIDAPLDDPRTEWLYHVALQTPLDVALAAVRHQRQLDLRGAIRSLRVPVLAAYSDRDPYYPPELGEYIAEQAPDGRAVTFHQSAHGTPFEEPERLAAIIDGFAKSPGARR